MALCLFLGRVPCTGTARTAYSIAPTARTKVHTSLLAISEIKFSLYENMPHETNLDLTLPRCSRGSCCAAMITHPWVEGFYSLLAR